MSALEVPLSSEGDPNWVSRFREPNTAPRFSGREVDEALDLDVSRVLPKIVPVSEFERRRRKYYPEHSRGGVDFTRNDFAKTDDQRPQFTD